MSIWKGLDTGENLKRVTHDCRRLKKNFLLFLQIVRRILFLSPILVSGFKKKILLPVLWHVRRRATGINKIVSGNGCQGRHQRQIRGNGGQWCAAASWARIPQPKWRRLAGSPSAVIRGKLFTPCSSGVKKVTYLYSDA